MTAWDTLVVGRPNVGERERLMRRLDGVLDRLWLTNNGPLVREFEERIAAVAGTRHAVATCNATTGIQIAARAAGIRPGDEVIVPSFTWVATAHALEWIGIVPVFCDVDEATANADPEHVARLIGPRTRGILAVHVFGHPCDVEALTRLADEHGLVLLFDAAHALGCTYRGRPVGGFGTAEIFSFHATKFVNSVEGGVITTDDDAYAARVRALRNQGIDPGGRIAGPGTVARMNEFCAAMGLTSLDAIDTIVAANRRNQAVYEEHLAGVPGVSVRGQAPGERANHQYLVIEVEEALAGISRETVLEDLLRYDVHARRYFSPICHQVEPYRSAPERHLPLPLPRAEALASRVLSLPTGPTVEPGDVAAVCAIIKESVARAGRRLVA
ncbi:aminotransferase class I/II-fold pyridoxal phosphate-dependent enzyme [Nonomuraea gerenzanensis]|uniref:Aminotransferase, DegT/DnrJ/EryC1/StrS family n=1 Tax=Nonomuraea gerenzanensis TaxID=93944 RepID=A0A1M4EAE5_9ACTN|nr:aminotransferase class I/II-fold pyridoxal phosphate-dependent enzyme [Nonomuraea gerenzanensis]UBU18040.1 aminotransferase class I/II-fold pyridoxal phosphate-dependent enzyme [Nonomuraea gerenzanensis]SBO95845.1 Aminotransferase, DegT/DnrJ/EryC1/StrS family [Nonomuraea gerenzanensis]